MAKNETNLWKSLFRIVKIILHDFTNERLRDLIKKSQVTIRWHCCSHVHEYGDCLVTIHQGWSNLSPTNQPSQKLLSRVKMEREIHFLPPGESPVVTLFTQIWRGDDTVDTADDTKVHCSWHGGPKLFPNCPQFTALSPIEVPGRIPHMETLMKDTESKTHKWDTLSHNQPDLSSVFIHNKASDGIPILL